MVGCYFVFLEMWFLMFFGRENVLLWKNGIEVVNGLYF